MQRLLWLPVLALLTYACQSPGPGPAASRPATAPTTPTPVATPTPWASGLLAVLRESQSADEVLVADSAGAVQGHASFTPPTRPVLGNAADLLQSPVRIAAGSVFFADGAGVVRRLDGGGHVAAVTTFPITDPSRQELAYAVSPDGTRLMASILTTPPYLHPGTPYSIVNREPLFVPDGHWTLGLYTAVAGGAAVSTLTKDLGADPRVTMVVGWDRSGPLATLNSNLATQGGPVSERFTGSALIHIGPEGAQLDQVGGAGCRPYDELPDGTTVCAPGDLPSPLQVRTAAGKVLWQGDPGDGFGWTPHLSPDGSQIAIEGTLLSRAGGTVTLGPAVNRLDTFRAEGWLDRQTVIGVELDSSRTTAGNLQLVGVSRPAELHELPIDGRFIGLL